MGCGSESDDGNNKFYSLGNVSDKKKEGEPVGRQDIRFVPLVGCCLLF